MILPVTITASDLVLLEYLMCHRKKGERDIGREGKEARLRFSYSALFPYDHASEEEHGGRIESPGDFDSQAAGVTHILHERFLCSYEPKKQEAKQVN